MMMIFVNIYFIFYPADLCTALHPMMKILVLVKQREWRTVLQPLVATEDRLVKDGKIKSLEEIYLYSLPIKVFCLMSQSLKNHDPHFSYR